VTSSQRFDHDPHMDFWNEMQPGCTTRIASETLTEFAGFLVWLASNSAAKPRPEPRNVNRQRFFDGGRRRLRAVKPMTRW
jgi:hypothetical protein